MSKEKLKSNNCYILNTNERYAPIKFPFNPHTLYKPNMKYINLLPNIKKVYNVWLLPTKMDSNDPYFKRNRFRWEMGNKRNMIKNDIVYIYVSSEKKFVLNVK